MDIELDGKGFEVTPVLDPSLLLVSLAGAIQGCAEIVNGTLVVKLAGDGSAVVSARTVAEIVRRAGFGIGFPMAPELQA